jgi:hypothetical protein
MPLSNQRNIKISLTVEIDLLKLLKTKPLAKFILKQHCVQIFMILSPKITKQIVSGLFSSIHLGLGYKYLQIEDALFVLNGISKTNSFS